MRSILTKVVTLSALALVSIGSFLPTSALAQSLSHLGNGEPDVVITFDHARGGFDIGRVNHDTGGFDNGRDHYDIGRGGYDRGRDNYDRGHDRHDHGRYRGCRDEAVTLLCKINGRHNYITAYTDCGYTREGEICNRVETPGYYQISMRIAYRCEYGRMVWLLGNDGKCKLTY